jgi:cytochrome c-type biogenesis protein CcmH
MKMNKPSTPDPFSLRAKDSQSAFQAPLHEGEGRFAGVRALSALIIALLLVFALPAAAQTQTITDDEVNAIAGKLYCPVCENIPLDVCPTLACAEWRAEIRNQLAGGATEQEVINDFVARYGERVVGTPLDPMLRTLSLLTPWLLGLVAVIGAITMLARWRMAQPQRSAAADSVNAGTKDDEYYRARVEQDLQARR